MNITESQIDIAEEIVYRWYSITRHMKIESPNSINSLRVNLVHTLVKNYKHDKAIADKTVINCLHEWIDKNEGEYFVVQGDKALDTLIEIVHEMIKKA